MLKTKFLINFRSSNHYLDIEINNWIEKNQDKKIIDIKFAINEINYYALILYEEIKSADKETKVDSDFIDSHSLFDNSPRKSMFGD